MKFYLSGFSLAGLLVMAANFRIAYAFPYLIESVYVMMLVPLICAWGAASFCHRLRPRRLLDVHRRGWLRPLVTGGVTGCVLLLGAGYIAYATPIKLQADLLIGALTIPCVWLSLIERSARYAGFLCRSCRYDLRGSLAAGRCPECGLAFDAPAPAGMPMATPVGEAA